MIIVFFFPLENPLFYALFNTFERKNRTLIVTWPIMIIITIINQKLLSVLKSYIGLIIKAALMMVVINSQAPLYTHTFSFFFQKSTWLITKAFTISSAVETNTYQLQNKCIAGHYILGQGRCSAFQGTIQSRERKLLVASIYIINVCM